MRNIPQELKNIRAENRKKAALRNAENVGATRWAIQHFKERGDKEMQNEFVTQLKSCEEILNTHIGSGVITPEQANESIVNGFSGGEEWL